MSGFPPGYPYPWEVPDDQLRALTGRPGEMSNPGADRWGNAKLLKGGQANTFVNTTPQPIVTPMAIQVEFSLDGITFSPTVPATLGNNVQVDLIKSLDVLSGPAKESVILAPGDAMPFCTFIAKAVTVNISNVGEAAQPLFVNCVVAPTTMVDCTSIANPNPDGYSGATSARLAAVAATVYHQAAQPNRAQFYIQNRAASDLFVGFGATVDTTPGAELATIILPGGISAIAENSSYQGEITLQFAADDAAGYALLTTGTL